MALFLLVIIIAIVTGLIGVLVKGLLYLLIVAIVLFLVNLVAFGFHAGHRARRPAR